MLHLQSRLCQGLGLLAAACGLLLLGLVAYTAFVKQARRRPQLQFMQR